MTLSTMTYDKNYLERRLVEKSKAYFFIYYFRAGQNIAFNYQWTEKKENLLKTTVQNKGVFFRILYGFMYSFTAFFSEVE